MSFAAAVRSPAVAGMFYPGDAPTLRAELDRYLNTADSAETRDLHRGTLKALIVPHAGYIYSGATAGRAFAELAAISTRIRRVVVLGPTHRVAVRGIAIPALPAVQAFATPLGSIPLDQQAIAALNDMPQIVVSDAAHAQEHSLEVQLPFLQTVLGDFSLVPLAIGDATVDEVAAVLERLWGGDETLVVASSDLSHYHAYQEARRIDADTADHILKFELLTSFKQACGALPINGLLQLGRRRGMRIERLAQCNSGDTAGDRTRVVGYASFVLYEKPETVGNTNNELGKSLLRRARNAIAAQFGKRPAAVAADLPPLSEPGATFVTLTLDGQLRGCIGSLEAWRPLAEDVQANAVAAAFRDPRFAPLSADELETVRVEVSLLSKPVAMQFADENDALRQLRPGIDGVILVAGDRRSTFLPQVWEQLPAPRQFLEHLKQKAGLPAGWWSASAQLYRYEVQKWKE
jgi:AmmeMemoRadiSam system protein B/AmmeMemoRadiSam system protein A